jgi:RHS repeat-associated protein
MEYFAFGETFVEEHKNSHNSPYKYNSKELDEETGWYYYGARYYNPKVSLWLGVDPLAEKYPNMSPFNYCFNNPVMLIDPTGMGPGDERKEALAAIEKFANMKTTTVFDKIPKADFVKDLTNIIEDPPSIIQKSDGTCAAALLSKYAASQHPKEYVEAALSLYQTGEYKNDNLSLSATKEMKAEGANILSPVNTIMQGAITNWGNFRLSYNPNTDGSGLRSLFYPGLIESFLHDAFGLRLEKDYHTEFFPTTAYLSSINYYSNFVMAVGHVGYKNKLAPGLIPNHYFQIRGVKGNSITFWSWGNSDNSSTVGDYYNGVHKVWIIPKK